MSEARIAVVVKCWPRLSETFIAQEMAGLEARGLKLTIYSLRLPTDAAIHPVHARVKAPIVYLPEYLRSEPGRVLRAWWKARRLPGYRRALACFLRDWARERTFGRVRRFGQGLVLAAEMPAETGRLYAHFVHTPASATRYAALMRGLPWSVSAHAKDIWTTEAWDLTGKLAECDWLVTCTDVGLKQLRTLAPRPDRLHLVYHGLDLAHLPPPPATRPPRDGRDAAQPVVILSIGRKVEKKGYDDLLDALSRLPRTLNWRFEHVGGGGLDAALKARAQSLGIADRCLWHGPLPQKGVFAAYARADLFVLAAKRAEDGDQDGLPNVLMEAAQQRLALLSTRAGAIAEFVTDGDNGLLVDPAAPASLAAALERLASNPDLRARLGQRANDVVRTRFSYDAGVDWIARALGGPAAARQSPQARLPEARAAE